MDAFDSARTVLAVRSHEGKPIPPETIRQIIESARLTGSSRNRQPWCFIVVDDPVKLQQLGKIAKTGAYISQAAMAIVVAIEKTASAVSDASRAIQFMIMTGWSNGIGLNWVGLFELEQVSSLLKIPENLDVFAIIPFGYPIQAVGKGKKKRKPLEEVAHRNVYGNPFS